MDKLKEKELEISNTNFIGGWYVETSVCDDLISYFKSHPEKQFEGRVHTSSKNQIDVKHKTSTDITLFLNERIPELDRYISSLKKVTRSYLDKFPAAENVLHWGIREGINIQYYKPGEAYYTYHTERMSGFDPVYYRHLAFMTYLNDVTDEGGTEFFHQNLKVTPEKGLTLIWPVDWTHLHRGIPSPTQEKYIITGWFSFL